MVEVTRRRSVCRPRW